MFENQLTTDKNQLTTDKNQLTTDSEYIRCLFYMRSYARWHDSKFNIRAVTKCRLRICAVTHKRENILK